MQTSFSNLIFIANRSAINLAFWVFGILPYLTAAKNTNYVSCVTLINYFTKTFENSVKVEIMLKIISEKKVLFG